MRLIQVFAVMSLWLCMSQARAEDPVDRNFPGPYVGGQLTLGQAFKAGSGSPGTAYLLGADLGYGIKRDTWNRIELGLELATGKAAFTEKTNLGDVKVDLDLDLVMMLKAGYGYSLGDAAFGTFRIGAGIAQASYEGKLGGFVATDNTSGVAAMIGWDAFFPASPTMDFLFGASYRIFNFKFEGQDSFQMSFPGLYAGARVRL
ncbi:MAG: porin family protein [Pseudobdellovibrionaceae bacterium]|uniref:outer membrane beta-barrel protein n=1 Tax=Oligoflexus sp. TaxID=1971216 RepID=UPI0027BC36EC|nr:outer membrane beta-barrel protein [Oligoflexus sp.]MDQ3235544.1 porin family protein [Pseudobdellovibrionaceae bacterium]HYX39870.1 outer membrane beta-barrel protein [Oligoflexus sp.]